MRLIATITHEQKRAKVYRSEDEYVVKFYEGLVYFSEADYFTDSKEDALGSAKVWCQ